MLNNPDDACKDEAPEDICKTVKDTGNCKISMFRSDCKKTCDACGKLYTILYF